MNVRKHLFEQIDELNNGRYKLPYEGNFLTYLWDVVPL